MAVYITGVRFSRRGPGARLFCLFYCLFQQQHYLWIVRINPFSPSPSHSTTASHFFRYIAKILSGSGLAGVGGGRKYTQHLDRPTQPLTNDALSAIFQRANEAEASSKPTFFIKCQGATSLASYLDSPASLLIPVLN